MTNELSELDKALLAAANWNKAGHVFALLALGADIMAVDENGNTAANLLAMYNNGDAVVRLAEINPAVLMMWGDLTPAHWLAVYNNGDAVVRLAAINPEALLLKTPEGFTAGMILA